MTKTKEFSRKANYYVHTSNKPFNARRIHEMNVATTRDALMAVYIGGNDKLIVNRLLKGKPGDVVMWADDNGDDHLDKLTSSVRPAHVIGKVEEVVTKL